MDYRTQMKNSDNILEIDGLKTFFATDAGTLKAVNGVSFDVPMGKTVGVVGESGCGKSITGMSVLGLIPKQNGRIIAGEIRFNMGDYAIDLLKAPESVMRGVRGNHISMIFQEPMTSLNPVLKIGNQLDEVMLLHLDSMTERGVIGGKAEIKPRTLSLLKTVGIGDSERVYGMYPHELSGGMRQRIVIAMAVACAPSLIIADEPTTALDVTIQAQILELLKELKSSIKAGIILITHDLGVIAETADNVVVMYAGRAVEKGTVADIFNAPLHPYTCGLMKSKPSLLDSRERLYTIAGNVPNPIDLPDCCYFADRCENASEVCRERYPHETGDNHRVSCFNTEEPYDR